MSEINLTKQHKLGLKKAKAKVSKLADQLAQEYDLESEWDGDSLIFQRAGVSGQLDVSKDEVQLTMKLGFLMAAFKPKIEASLKANLDKFVA
jgi:putative polyhydroxyalkanoate system protein